jgi:hypothetical protein
MMRKLIGLLGGFALIGTAWAADPNTKNKIPSTESPSSASSSDSKSTTSSGEVDRSKPSTQSGDSSVGTSSGSGSTTGMTQDPKSAGRATGGSGDISRDRSTSEAGMQHQLSKNELTGKVVRVDNNMVWIDHLGAVVPLKIENNTKFESAGVTRAKDLKEGQEIRANFTVKDKTTNVATTIWLEGATSTGKTGSSDMDMQRRTTTTPKSPTTLPEDRGNRPATPPGDVK